MPPARNTHLSMQSNPCSHTNLQHDANHDCYAQSLRVGDPRVRAIGILDNQDDSGETSGLCQVSDGYDRIDYLHTVAHSSRFRTYAFINHDSSQRTALPHQQRYIQHNTLRAELAYSLTLGLPSRRACGTIKLYIPSRLPLDQGAGQSSWNGVMNER